MAGRLSRSGWAIGAMRVARGVVLPVALAVVLPVVLAVVLAAAQWINTSRVRDAVCGADRSACSAGSGWLGLDLRHELPGTALHLHGSSALLRKACDGHWTRAFGARLDLDGLKNAHGADLHFLDAMRDDFKVPIFLIRVHGDQGFRIGF